MSLGFVVGLDYADARLSVHDVLQEFKLHPLVRKILAGGKRVAWGAKAIPEGGYWALPRLHAPGMVICGDGGGMVNVPKLKGIHLAIRSGMLAAETLYERLKDGSTDFSAYEHAVHDSEIGKDLYESRNMKQPFGRGLIVGGAISNAMVVTKGRLPGGHWPTHRDADQPLLLTDRDKRYPKPDGKYTFDKLSSVFTTGNATRDDAPSHIRIQQRVPRELAEAWAWMCPAAVYEVPEDTPPGAEHVDLHREPLELRAVRRDHRQGRAPDAARGRRRTGLPGRPDAAGRNSGWSRGVNPAAMRRVLLICLLVLLGLPAGASAARVELTACVAALAAEERSATFEARVRRTRGSERMQVSFTAAGPRRDAAGLAPRRRRPAGRVADVRQGRAPLPLRAHRARTSPRRPPTGWSCASAGSTPTARCWHARGRRRASVASPTCART